MECSVSNDEAARLAALHRYKILDTAPEESFDRITRLAKTVLQTPMVMVSLVDADRQWFKSRQGTSMTETPRSVSFCTHTIKTDEPLIVHDALEHPLFYNSPLVQGPPHVRFYIGVPLVMFDGHRIGALCAVDQQPRELSADQINVMRDLARLVVDEIELRQIATTDSLTGALTRRGFDIEINREFKRAARDNHDLSLIAVDVDHFKSVNDTCGHAAGDLVLQTVVAQIKRALSNKTLVARIGGEEFVIALPETGAEKAMAIAEEIRQVIADTKVQAQSRTIAVTASFGIACGNDEDDDWNTILKAADTALYEAKQTGRNKCVCRVNPPAALLVA
jgi:diguanylate cyclase (GGDEF)-like protein